MRIDKKKLEILMAEKEMSATALCRISGLCNNTIYRIMKDIGKGNHYPSTVGAIAKALGCDINELLEE